MKQDGTLLKPCQEGFLSREAMKEYLAQCLAHLSLEETCAAFMIDAVEIDWSGAASETEREQQTIQYFRQVFSSLFRTADKIAQIGKRRFFIFISGGITEESVYEKAEKLCERLQFGLYGDQAVDISVCVGVYMGGGGALTCEKLYSRTLEALTKAQKRGSGSFFADIDVDTGRKKTDQTLQPAAAVPFHTMLKYLDGGVCLLELQDQIQIIYANAGFYQMFGPREEPLQLPCSLDKIGIHPDYRADYERAIRDLAVSGGVASCTQCVLGNGTDKIWRHVRTVKIDYPASRYPVVLELSTDISALVETQFRLRESNERLRVAFEQTPHILWEVDIQNRTFHTYDVNAQSCRADSMFENYPESLIENGIIHPDSVANFRVFAAELLNGSAAGGGNFIIRERDNNCYCWVALSYRMVCGQNGRPAKAVGVQRKLPDVSDTSHAFVQRALPEIVRHRLLARMQVNLTRNYTGKIWMYGADQTSRTWGKTYTELIESGVGRMFGKSVGNEFHERFSRRNLLDAFERGEFWSTREHRRVDPGGNIRWMADFVNLEYDPATEEVYMLACFCDEQPRNDWERLAGSAKRNETDGLYSAGDTKRISEYLIKEGAGAFCAAALIKIEGNIDGIDIGRPEPGRSLRDFIAVALSFALGTDCIASWYKENAILAFFPDAESKADMKKRLEDAFTYVRASIPALSGRGSVRFVGGVVQEQAEHADYDAMLLRAAYLCELGKNSPMDTVEFPEENEDWIWEKLQKENSEFPVKEEMKRRLSQEEQEAVLGCIAAMLSSVWPEKSMGNVLQSIGEYYNADRTYVLALSDDIQDVTMLYEWTGSGKHSIRNVMSGMQISKIPLLQRCRDRQEPVFAKSSREAAESRERAEEWNFMGFPLKRDGRVKGFLCVENARVHQKDGALLYTLIPYIQMDYARKQMLADIQSGSSGDTLSLLPNRRSYMDEICTFNSDRYSSMGVLTIDIPGFSEINSSFGFEYGREILQYCTDMLRSVFGGNYIFRTWDAEFVALQPNTIQAVFTGRCIRLRTMLQRRYPRQIRIGYTWSDGVFDAGDLVREARYMMHSESTDGTEEKKQSSDIAWLLEDKELEQKYVLYLQPKIDMRSGAMIGAETLVRGIDEKGNLIPPARFIEKLEENGKIRDLDFFVLKQVLQKLSEWKKQGLAAIHVSVNISRRTLLAPTTLASVLAIHSYYPEISLEQVGFEITETATNVEVATLAEIIQRYREFGIQFELDDFGSRYASMAVFSNIKFHTVKLDRSLINDLPGNEISRMLVKSIVEICRNSGITCIAEGVETQQQKQALLKAGCIYGQGYYYSRPVPVDQFEAQYLKKSEG